MTRLLSLLIVFVSSAQAQVQVPFARIRDAEKEPENWLTYSGGYFGQRHSALTQLTRDNVNRLKPVWVYQSRDVSAWEISPLVVDGVMFLSELSNIVTAIDVKTGRVVWRYRRPIAQNITALGGGQISRGLAILGDALYLCTGDSHLVCIDASTGNERWASVIDDYKLGYVPTGAPLAINGKIVVGIAGGDFGIRGFLDAYDAQTGKRAWRFWTVPAPGERGHETWGAGDSWQRGGAATWITGSYDPELNVVYWGTGNPGPDFNGDDRPGDNLYSNCLLAIDADSGKLRWHFQYTPHDVHDWDSNQVPILVDLPIDGKPRKLVVQANRSGFYYVLDRITGDFVTGSAFVKVSWATGLSSQGRPMVIPGSAPSEEGVLVYPGIEGAVNWPSPAYNPQTGLFYVQAQGDNPHLYFKHAEEFRPGQPYYAGSGRPPRGLEPYGTVKAIEAQTGRVRWEHKLHTSAGGGAGVLSTAGSLVFSGSRDGWFFAIDALTGETLWRFNTGAGIASNPISFAVDGRQLVAVAAGQSIFVFGL